MSRKREVDELLDEFGVLLVPRVEKLQLPTREVRLDAFDAGELGRVVPDELVGNGETGYGLAFMQHELEVGEFGVGLRLTERVRLDAHDLVVEEVMQLDDLINEPGVWQPREITVEDDPGAIVLEHGDDGRVIGDPERGVAECKGFCALKVDL